MATELHDCLVSSTDVPIGYAVLDTACLTSCGGGQTIDKYVQKYDVDSKVRKSNKVFRGVNVDAPVPAENETELRTGLCGKTCELKVHRLPESATPILLSLPQLSDLDTVIHCRDRVADFKALNLMNVPLESTGKGHLMVNISEWDKHAKDKPKKPLVSSETISVWKTEAEEMIKQTAY